MRCSMKILAAAVGLAAMVASPIVPALAAGPTQAAAREVHRETAAYDFAYAYPAAAAAIPALRQRLEADMARQLADLRKGAADGQAAARADQRPFNPYLFSKTWQVVTQVPGWLSLSARLSGYSGGAHGMHWSDSLLWDKRANRARQSLDLFVSRAALNQAVRGPFCDALDRERARRREAPVNRDSGDMFDECIEPADQVVILGSASRRAFDRVGFLIAPYNAGPYVEGAYEVTVPVTPAVLAAVRPQYRASFALSR